MQDGICAAGEEDSPSRTSHSTGSFHCASQHDELHPINHRRAAASADEGLDERFESVHGEYSVYEEVANPKLQVLRATKCGWEEEK